MKRSPYKEILDLGVERKEYARLCNGKSERFKLYSEWEGYIKSRLLRFKTDKDLDNFKHYCINEARTQENAPTMYLSYVGLFIPIYLDTVYTGMPPIVTIILAFAVVVYIILQNKKLAKESYFFKDIIEIIDKIETNSDELREGKK